jgi:hypothetical protein
VDADEGSAPIEFGERTLVTPMSAGLPEEGSMPINLEDFQERTLVQPMPKFAAGEAGVDLKDIPAEYQDDVQNLEFLIDAGLTDDALDLLEDLRKRTDDAPFLTRYARLILAAPSAGSESDAHHRG